MFKRRYGILDEQIDNIGVMTKFCRLKEFKDKRLSEYEVQAAYADYRFIIAPPYKKPNLTWLRTRFLFGAMNDSIVLAASPEVEFYGDAYQLDASVFALSVKQQAEIAHAQSEWLLNRVISEDQNIENFRKVLE